MLIFVENGGQETQIPEILKVPSFLIRLMTLKIPMGLKMLVALKIDVRLTADCLESI
jgi:hypothetical protein